MSTELYRLLARTLCVWSPETPVHCRSHAPLVAHSLPLNHEATFFDYVVIGGKRYHASRTAGMNNSSLVHVTIPQRSGQGVINAYGEILELFRFDQDIHHQGESLYFARMRWFKRWDGERETIWDTL